MNKRAITLLATVTSLTAALPAVADAQPGRECFGRPATILAPSQRGEAPPSGTVGTKGADVIVAVGNTPNAVIRGKGGDDLICFAGRTSGFADGGAGDDRIHGATKATLEGGSGDDRLYGGRQRGSSTIGVLLLGHAGDDLLVGTDRNDAIHAQAGDDTVRGLAGGDNLSGGEGADRVDGGSDNDDIDDERLDREKDIDRDLLLGGPGEDRISDGGGRDHVAAGSGDDVVEPAVDEAGDVFIGGSGFDDLSYFFYFPRGFFASATGGSGVTITLDGVANDGAGCPDSCENNNVAAGWEQLTGSGAGDVLIGNARANTLLGGQRGGRFDRDPMPEPDHLDGGGGGDRLRGWGTLLGGDGDDFLRGSELDDHLDGGTGSDTCDGDRAGSDTAANCETVRRIP